MPHSFFILSRLFVRVDNVLFRLYDVRTYHEFGSREIVREITGMEADYEAVKRVSLYLTIMTETTENCIERLEKPSDLSPLTSSNFVHGVMTSMTGADGRPTLSRRSSGKAWPGLERRVDVLLLPSDSGDMDGTRDGLENLSI